jgi:hypothetical protein
MKEERERKLPADLQKKDNVNYTLHNLDLMAFPPIDCKIETEEVVRQRCYDYMETCMRNNMKPSVAGFALSIGVSRQTLIDYINGVTPIPKQNRIALERFYGLLNSLMEDYIQNGKINPVAGLFLTKNNFGYKDTQEFVVNNRAQEETSPDALIEEANLLFDGDAKKAEIE